jgi:uncharacterized protein (UPF0332 family)
VTEQGHGLARGREEIEAARLLADAGFGAAAVSRSYYAAEAALLALGETRSKHSGVIAAVAQVAVRRHGLDPQAGRLLRSLFDRRSQADYGLTAVPPEEAAIAVSDAERVVDVIEAWLTSNAAVNG